MDNLVFIIILVIAALLILPLLYMRISAFMAVGKQAPDFSELMNDDIDISRSVYIYFMSDNCSMCKAMTPHIEDLQHSNPNILSVNINTSPELARRFHILGTPTLLGVKEGRITKVKLGGLNRNKIETFIQ